MEVTASPAPCAPADPVAPAHFRAAMARLAGAVSIVTTDGPGGRAGFTATAVCSVSADPPMLLVCINEQSSAGPVFRANPAVCVNTIGPRHVEIARLFGGGTPMHTRFEATGWHRAPSGAPRLEDSLVSFDCRIARTVVMGTHRVFFCLVEDIALSDESVASIWLARKFHQIEMDS